MVIETQFYDNTIKEWRFGLRITENELTHSDKEIQLELGPLGCIVFGLLWKIQS